jgi:cytidine deaminase
VSALETDDGEIVVGANVESASYGLTVCAERVAVWNAISHGKRKIKKIAVVADTEKLTPPCGVCRQIIWEFGGDIPVIFANLHGQVETVQMRDLLPRAFDTKFLE